ncbi:MAG: phosphoribosyltransferase [Chloroflexi bacterium]|nr:phosphoribosyltransferase [Chloroflexota bacterium]
MFRDRREAGAQLAARLSHLEGEEVVVLAIPRGGVPVAAEAARALEAYLDVMVARKLGAPSQPELAIGAVTASGAHYLNEDVLREVGVTPGFLRAITAQAVAEARRQEERLRTGRPPPRVADRVVVLVDDGLATGATMGAAIRSVRQKMPRRIVVGVPVAPPSTCAALRAEADEIIAVEQPEPFLAVGMHYVDFRPVGEGEIRELLQSFWPKTEG